MIFKPTPFEDAWLVVPEPFQDERGSFERTFCREEFKANGIDFEPVQCNLSRNSNVGTMRGMHYQVAPTKESKLVRCIRGRMYDVIVDMRIASPTYLTHFGVELSDADGSALYIPAGFAHGFLTLEENCEVYYLMGDSYRPGKDAGLRYDDPSLHISWPVPIRIISEKDRSWPLISTEDR